MTTRSQQPGAVYYVTNSDCSRIKIGYSANLTQRLRSLKSEYGDVALLAWEYGSRDVESMRHGMFAHIRIQGEWFAVERELVDFLRSLLAKQAPVSNNSMSGFVGRHIVGLTLSKAALCICSDFQKRLGVTRSALIEMAVREFAERRRPPEAISVASPAATAS